MTKCIFNKIVWWLFRLIRKMLKFLEPILFLTGKSQGNLKWLIKDEFCFLMERCCPVSALRSTARLLGVISDWDIMTSYKPNIANGLRPIHRAAAEASLCVLSGITVIKFLNNFRSSVSQQNFSLYNLYWRVWWAPFFNKSIYDIILQCPARASRTGCDKINIFMIRNTKASV